MTRVAMCGYVWHRPTAGSSFSRHSMLDGLQQLCTCCNAASRCRHTAPMQCPATASTIHPCTTPAPYGRQRAAHQAIERLRALLDQPVTGQLQFVVLLGSTTWHYRARDGCMHDVAIIWHWEDLHCELVCCLQSSCQHRSIGASEGCKLHCCARLCGLHARG